MEKGQEQTRQAEEIASKTEREVQACATLLREAWACLDAARSPAEMRSGLTAITAQSAGRGGQALEVFDKLAARVADLGRDAQPEWLRTALRGKTPEYLAARLTPTAIIVSIPEKLFAEIRPGSNGVTLSDLELPEELRGRIILMPDPPRPGHAITLRHELIHSIEIWAPPRGLCATSAHEVIRNATNREQVLEQISLMGFFPRGRAQSEVVAYLGSQSAASSLEPYGLRESRQELELVFKGLAFNTNLSLAEKAELYERGVEKYRQSILDAVALTLNFEDLILKDGVENAVARTLVQGFAELDYGRIPSRAETLSKRLEGLLANVPWEGHLSESINRDWDILAQDILLCPHPTLIPHIVEVIHRSKSAVRLADFIEVFERAVEWSPEALVDVDLERLRDRLSVLAMSADPFLRYAAKPAANLLERIANGGLTLSPFNAKDPHPHIRINEALRSDAPIPELIRLLSEVYPHRHPIWNEMPIGVISEKTKSAGLEERIALKLALVRHSSQEDEIVWGIIFLGSRAKYGQLNEAHLSALKGVVTNLPAVEKITWYSEETKLWYQEALTRLASSASLVD